MIYQLNNQDLFSPSSIAVKIFIGKIPKTWSEEEVLDFFKRFGKIQDAQVIRDNIGSHRGCAFVTFYSMTEADIVIGALNEKIFLPGVN